MPRDYILRLIDQMATMLAGILAKKNAGEIIEARKDIDTLALETIGLTLDSVKKLSPEAVAHLLEELGALRPARAVKLAELLILDAEMREPTDASSQPLPNDVHAFCLLADVMDSLNSEEQSIYRPKLERLAAGLGDLRSHPYIMERLGDYGNSPNA